MVIVDPVTLILAALAAGASAGVSKAASSAVSDAYAGLKSLIKERFAGNTKAEETLSDHDAHPDVYEKPLAMQIEATGADKDEGILRAAEELLKAADSAGVKTKYNVTVHGNVSIIGDYGHIEN